MAPSEELPLDTVLAQTRYVRPLARELVFDAHLARDVEQETWLAALEHGPRDRGALRGWLAAMVRNFALKAWRSSARRTAREQATARAEASVPGPAETLAREEQRQGLIRSVLALEEPLRAVLVLRFFEELPPRAVARRLGLPVETVRTRTKRGLELLRARLDRETRGGREAWCLALVRGLRLPLRGSEIAAGFVSFLPGVLLMSLAQKAALAAGMIALLVGGFVLRNRLVQGEEGETLRKDVVELVAPERSEAPELPAVAPLATRTEVSAPEPAPVQEASAQLGAVLLRVTWQDGTPAADIGATFHPSLGAEYQADAFDVQTGPDGTVRINSVSPGPVEAWLDRGVSARGEVQAGGCLELPMRIPLGYDVDGVVLESDERPVAGAEILASSTGVFAQVVTRSDGAGRFHVRSLSERSCYLSARAPLHAPTPQQRLEAGSGYVYTLRLVFAAIGGALEGTVQDETGRGLAHAKVLVGEEDQYLHDIRLPGGGKALPAASQLASTDEQGRYRIDGVSAGRQVVRVLARGYAHWKGETEIFEREAARLDVALDRGTIVEGTVTDPSARPIAGVQVGLVREFGLHSCACKTDAEGRFELGDLPTGEFSLYAEWAEQTCASARLFGRPGAVLRWDPVIDGGLHIRGRIVVKGQGPTPGFFIWSFHDASGQRGLTETVHSDANGVFEFVKCANVPHRIEVASSQQPMIKLASIEGVLPGGDELVIEVDSGELPTVRFRGRVLDARGEPMGFVGVSPHCAERNDGTSVLFSARADGTFDLGPYPAGRWRIVVYAPRSPQLLLTSEFVDVAADQTHDFGDLRVAR